MPPAIPLTDEEKRLLAEAGKFGMRFPEERRAECWEALCRKIKEARDGRYPSDWASQVLGGLVFVEAATSSKAELEEVDEEPLVEVTAEAVAEAQEPKEQDVEKGQLSCEVQPEAFYPPTVEQRVPTNEEMLFKASNGRHYLEDVWVIEREFPSKDEYGCRTDLDGLVNKLYPAMRDLQYTLVDSSDMLNDCHHALELTMAWANVVRNARTTQTMHILRRTPANSGAMLMMQRQEHLRGQCSEWAPVAYIALFRDQQLVVTRDRVMQQDATERMLLAWVKRTLTAAGADATEDDESSVPARHDGPSNATPNMSPALFKQQMQGVKAMLDAMTIEKDATGSTAVRGID